MATTAANLIASLIDASAPTATDPNLVSEVDANDFMQEPEIEQIRLERPSQPNRKVSIAQDVLAMFAAGLGNRGAVEQRASQKQRLADQLLGIEREERLLNARREDRARERAEGRSERDANLKRAAILRGQELASGRAASLEERRREEQARLRDKRSQTVIAATRANIPLERIPRIGHPNADDLYDEILGEAGRTLDERAREPQPESGPFDKPIIEGNSTLLIGNPNAEGGPQPSMKDSFNAALTEANSIFTSAMSNPNASPRKVLEALDKAEEIAGSVRVRALQVHEQIAEQSELRGSKFSKIIDGQHERLRQQSSAAAGNAEDIVERIAREKLRIRTLVGDGDGEPGPTRAGFGRILPDVEFGIERGGPFGVRGRAGSR